MPRGEGEGVCWGVLSHKYLHLQAASPEWLGDDESVYNGASRRSCLTYKR